MKSKDVLCDISIAIAWHPPSKAFSQPMLCRSRGTRRPISKRGLPDARFWRPQGIVARPTPTNKGERSTQLPWGQKHMVEFVGADEGLLPQSQQRVWTAAPVLG
jgi:hypothetical protein